MRASGSGFEFQPVQLESVDLPAIGSFFQDLPRDHYIDGDFRRRRLSRFRRGAEDFEQLPHQAFMQSDYVNRLYGNIQRDYQELEDELVALPAFRAILERYVDFFGIEPGAETVLGVHQIRIVASPEEGGEPAPEGIHQDGFDHLAIICVARDGLVGGETRLYRDPEGAPIFSSALRPGEGVFVNDRAVYHYTSPLAPSADGEGHRDVFVITAG